MTPRKPKDREQPPERGPEQKKNFADEPWEDVDVQRIHMNIISREKGEPEEGFEPTPWWVWTASVLLLFAMGFYLGRYGGTFSFVAHEVEQPSSAIAAPLKREVHGDVVYAGVCQPCHQATGEGVPGQYPPLAGSEWLLQDSETPARIVLFGLQGDITVRGATFNNKMPAFSEKLTNEEISAVLSHVRGSWGNKAGPISADQIDSLRTKFAGRAPWSAGELHSLRRKKPA
jgi:mono/diheme cytochrome c family protein